MYELQLVAKACLWMRLCCYIDSDLPHVDYINTTMNRDGALCIPCRDWTRPWHRTRRQLTAKIYVPLSAALFDSSCPV